MNLVDAGLTAADSALRTLFAPHRAARPCPTVPEAGGTTVHLSVAGSLPRRCRRVSLSR